MNFFVVTIVQRRTNDAHTVPTAQDGHSCWAALPLQRLSKEMRACEASLKCMMLPQGKKQDATAFCILPTAALN